MSDHTTVACLLASQARVTPTAMAITAPGRKPLSYGRLWGHVQETAVALARAGVRRRDRVAIVLPNGPEMATAFLGAAAIATAAPLNPAYRARDFDFYLSDLDAKALIVSAADTSAARSMAQKHGIRVIELTADQELAAGMFRLEDSSRSIERAVADPEPGDVALVLHTSGSTARPKMVPLTHENICSSARHVAATLGLVPADRCLNVMPLFHIHGLIAGVLASLSAGASVVCTPGLEDSQFFHWTDEAAPTWYTAVPTMHQRILAEAEKHAEVVGRHPFRLIRSSSSALPPQVMARLEAVFGAPVIEAYGMTEASHQITSNPLPPAGRKPGSVGLAAGPDVAVMDEQGRLLRSGEAGEVVIRGANVTRGYAKNPTANEQAYTDGWFRTGDEGVIDRDGYLRLTGRLKEMVNRGGEKIAPREIDEVLLDHPDVVQAVAFGVPHPTLGEDLAAAVVLQPGVAFSEKSLRDFARGQLVPYKVPSRFLAVDQIPKGPTGKLRRVGLADELAAELRPEYIGPRDTVEKELARIWETTFRVNRVGARDNFFALGGDSLLATSLLTQIERTTGRKLPVEALLEAPTLGELAGLVRDKDWAANSSTLVPLQPHGSRPPLFFVHAHGGNVMGYRALAERLGLDQPFYGLEDKGAASNGTTHHRIEDMAAEYISAVRAAQPNGPYTLGGYCMGGVVAYEMARQLSAAGQHVSLVVMLQSRCPDFARSPSRTTWMSALFYRLLSRLDRESRNFWEVQRKQKAWYCRDRTVQVARRIVLTAEKFVHHAASKCGMSLPPSHALKHDRLGQLHRQAYNSYLPGKYAGRVAILRCSKQPAGARTDVTLGWRDSLEGEVHTVDVPGHLTRLLAEPRVTIVAETMRGMLETVADPVTVNESEPPPPSRAPEGSRRSE